MFDEVDNKPAVPPVNTRPLGAPVQPPIAVEDIFVEVDKTAKPDVFRPNPNSSNPPRGTVIPPATGWKSNKAIVLGLLFGGLAIVVAGGYFGLKLALKDNQAADTPVEKTTVQEQPKNTEVEPVALPPTAEVNETATPTVQPAAPLDSDSDGLTDDEEASLGTDPYNADTDQDGLTDREEAKVYKTDPLNSDTDGDGFKDGAEIKNGYNPKGAGKLLNIK